MISRKLCSLYYLCQVGRLLQPSVVFIDQAEKTFIKKVKTSLYRKTHFSLAVIIGGHLQVSKTDKSDPKRLRKDLPKLVKNIAPEDQMILIGKITSLPE